MLTNVRRASLKDLGWILFQLRAFERFYGSSTITFPNEEYAQNYFAGMIRDHLVLIAEEEPHGQVGFISGIVTPHPFNPEKRLLSEQFWWVAEEHQGSRAGLLLLNEFTAWGEKNCDMVTMSKLPQTPISERHFTKRGYRLVEHSYLKEIS